MITSKILVCTHHLLAWTGSEMVAIELAEGLEDRGVDVTYYVPFLKPEFLAEAVAGKTVISDASLIDLSQFDLVYCQHQTLSQLVAQQPEVVFDTDRRPLIVYNHLSSVEPFELPGPFVEADIADVIWCQSPRTRENLLPRFGAAFEKMTVVANPSPAGFRKADRRLGKLQRILSVSNHLPSELAEAFEILASQGVEVIRLGAPDLERRLTPQDLDQVDGVVTIGKTTQAAFAARVPVFVYDHFGGPGWLSDAASFEASRLRNFSGLNDPVRRGPQELAGLILSGHEGAASFAAGLSGATVESFLWDTYIDDLMAALDAHLAAPRSIAALQQTAEPQDAVAARWRREARLYELVDREYGLKRQFEEKAEKVGHYAISLRDQLAAAQERIATLEAQARVTEKQS